MAQTARPRPGATVNGSATGADGKATLAFSEAGIYRLKAERADSIRSNALVALRRPAGGRSLHLDRQDGAEPRHRPARQAPGQRARALAHDARLVAGRRLGRRGVSYYSVDVREVAERRTGEQDRAGRVEVDRGSHHAHRGSTSAATRAAYQFRITAVDRAANRTSVETDPLVLPVDDRDRGLLRFSRGWKRIKRQAAWGRHRDEGQRPPARRPRCASTAARSR